MRTQLAKTILVISTLAMTTGLVSCGGQKDADKVGEAQLCLDSATQGSASACVEKIADINTASANLLRCTAGFIDEGFTSATRLQNAFNALKAGSQSAESFMSVLAFTSKSTSALNLTSAQQTATYCTLSGSKAYILLGSMSSTATSLAKIAGSFINGATPATSDIVGAVTTALSDPTTKAAVGTAVSTVYTSSCKTGTQVDTTLCGQMDTALTGVDLTNSTAVGNAILNYWNTHSN